VRKKEGKEERKDIDAQESKLVGLDGAVIKKNYEKKGSIRKYGFSFTGMGGTDSEVKEDRI